MAFMVCLTAFAGAGVVSAEDEEETTIVTLYEEEEIDVAVGEDYETNFTVGEDENIEEVFADGFELTGEDLVDGEEETVTIEVTDSEDGVVETEDHTVAVGDEPVDLSTLVESATLEEDEEHTLIISVDNPDAGFTADLVEVTGESPEEDGGPILPSDGPDGVVIVLIGAILIIALLVRR